MGAIKDRSVVDLDMAAEFACIPVSRCNSTMLGFILDGIKESADSVCQNRFIKREGGAYYATKPIYDDDGNEQDDDIPSGVEAWILRKFARCVQFKMSGNNSVTNFEIDSVKLDARDWAELTPFIDYNAGPRTTEDSQGNFTYPGEQRDNWEYSYTDDGWMFPL